MKKKGTPCFDCGKGKGVVNMFSVPVEATGVTMRLVFKVCVQCKNTHYCSPWIK